MSILSFIPCLLLQIASFSPGPVWTAPPLLLCSGRPWDGMERRRRSSKISERRLTRVSLSQAKKISSVLPDRSIRLEKPDPTSCPGEDYEISLVRPELLIHPPHPLSSPYLRWKDRRCEGGERGRACGDWGG